MAGRYLQRAVFILASASLLVAAHAAYADTSDTHKYNTKLTSATVVSYDNAAFQCRIILDQLKDIPLQTTSIRLFEYTGYAPTLKYIDLPTSQTYQSIRSTAMHHNIGPVLGAFADHWTDRNILIMDGGAIGMVAWRENKLYLFAFWRMNGIRVANMSPLDIEANAFLSDLGRYLKDNEKSLKLAKRVR